MKYRHAYHAGNFADLHKHVALVALLRLLQQKDKGLLFVDTHAGRGRYALGGGEARMTGEALAGAGAVLAALQGRTDVEPELADYTAVIAGWRRASGARHDYPGSPLIAAQLLRPQDRGIAIESQPAEFEALRKALGRDARVTAEHGDGYARLRALLPPPTRRGLVLIDPPYEDSRADFRAAAAAMHAALERFETCVIAIWYPVKDARDTDRWLQELARELARPACAAELWVHPPDSRAGLNGSGLVVVNPPWHFAQRCEIWQAALWPMLARAGAGAGTDGGSGGGSRVVSLAGERR